MADIDKKEATAQNGVSRREFITGVGGLGVGAVLGGALLKGILLPDEVLAIPASEGYLLVDTMKCAGCESCMLACSMVHTGETNLSLSRIQINNNVFAGFPGGVEQNQCRQCPYPACVDACPTGAMHVDAENGNIRTVDEAKCIGCERCVNACPFTPSRVQWNFEDKNAQKCDLCANAPYMTDAGGPGGMQACVAVCPTQAISFTTEIPTQTDAGYQVNLRSGDPAWPQLGFPTGDNGEFEVTPGKVDGGV